MMSESIVNALVHLFAIFESVKENFAKDAGETIKTLNVDGGMANNNLILEIQATVGNVTIIRPKICFCYLYKPTSHIF